MTAVDLPRLRGLLAELDEHLAQAGVEYALPRGLGEEEVHARSNRLGAELPTELVEFFRWHDGFGDLAVPMPHAPISLEYSLRNTQALRQNAVEYAASTGEDPDPYWSPSWFVFGAETFNMPLAVDCTAQTGCVTPVFFVVMSDVREDGPGLVATSLTEHIERWVQLWRLGAYAFDHVTGRPRRILVSDRIPPEFAGHEVGL